MKLHVWLLLVLLSVPQAEHGETLASSADHTDGLLMLHSPSQKHTGPINMALRRASLEGFVGEGRQDLAGPS